MEGRGRLAVDGQGVPSDAPLSVARPRSQLRSPQPSLFESETPAWCRSPSMTAATTSSPRTSPNRPNWMPVTRPAPRMRSSGDERWRWLGRNGQITKDLGIAESGLRRWMAQADIAERKPENLTSAWSSSNCAGRSASSRCVTSRPRSVSWSAAAGSSPFRTGRRCVGSTRWSWTTTSGSPPPHRRRCPIRGSPRGRCTTRSPASGPSPSPRPPTVEEKGRKGTGRTIRLRPAGVQSGSRLLSDSTTGSTVGTSLDAAAPDVQLEGHRDGWTTGPRVVYLATVVRTSSAS